MSHLLEDIAKAKAYTELSIIAYGSLALMSCLCIFIGAWSSISKVQENKENHQEAAFKSPKDAVKLFLQMICGCLISYIFPDLFSNFYMNTLIKLIITIKGVIELKRLLRPLVSKLIPENDRVHFQGITNISFSSIDIIAFAICSKIGAVYFWNNYWFLNNIFIMLLAIEHIKSTHLNNIKIACTNFGLVIIWNIVCFFMLDAMITIENWFKDLNLLVFPKNILDNLENGSEFSKLALATVVLPGCFIALLLRFDKSLNRGEKLYFISGFVGYIVGFVAMVVMEFTFEHKQLAWLYLIPACISIPSIIVVIKGDIEALINYRDY